jgi:hypothetical protein
LIQPAPADLPGTPPPDTAELMTVQIAVADTAQLSAGTTCEAALLLPEICLKPKPSFAPPLKSFSPLRTTAELNSSKT